MLPLSVYLGVFFEWLLPLISFVSLFTLLVEQKRDTPTHAHTLAHTLNLNCLWPHKLAVFLVTSNVCCACVCVYVCVLPTHSLNLLNFHTCCCCCCCWALLQLSLLTLATESPATPAVAAFSPASASCCCLFLSFCFFSLFALGPHFVFVQRAQQFVLCCCCCCCGPSCAVKKATSCPFPQPRGPREAGGGGGSNSCVQNKSTRVVNHSSNTNGSCSGSGRGESGEWRGRGDQV